MGKILDEFMKKHDLDDAHVLAMIGNACMQIVDPEVAYAIDRKKVIPDDVRKEAETMIDETALAVLAALMDRSLRRWIT